MRKNTPCVVLIAATYCFAVLLGGCSGAKVARQAASPPPVAKQKSPPPAESRYLNPAHDQPLPPDLNQPLIEIHKKKRKLYLFGGDKLWRAYNVKLGLNPEDDKIKQGDQCTPEGKFYVCVKNPKSRYYLSLGLSYPSMEHAEKGLQENLITEKEYTEIVRSLTRGTVPPWNTALGGEIFIHGGADVWQWTYGCVALKNKDIEELYRVVKLGTEVVIKK